MDIKDWLQNYCDERQWVLVHGRRHDQNLDDAVNWFNEAIEDFGDREVFVFLDPYTTETNSDNIDTFTGSFMIASPNDLDDRDADIFNSIVKPLKPLVKKISQSMRCTYDVNRFSQIDVYNVKDLNVSGINISFNLKAE